MKKILFIILVLPITLLAQYTGSVSDGYNSKMAIIGSWFFNPGTISGTQSVCIDEDPSTFVSEVSATATSNISYQWEYSLDGNIWANIDGATSEVYDAPELGAIVTAPASVYARRRAYTDINSGYSNTVIITVNDCIKYYLLSAKHTSKVIDVSAFGGEGTNVQQWVNLKKDNQLWAVNDAGNGYFWLEPKHAKGQCMEIGGWSTINGGNVIIWTYLGNDNQKWYVQDAGEGYYRLINKHSNLSIEVENAYLNDGANILQDVYNGVQSEMFTTIASNVGKVESSDPLLPYVKGQTLVNEKVNIVNMTMSPNPFVDRVSIKIDRTIKEDVTLKLYNLNGQLIDIRSFNTNTIPYQNKDLESGIYLLQIWEGSTLLKSDKLIKK